LIATDPARKHRLIFRTALVIALLGAAVAVAVPAGLGWDFANFYDTGRRAAHGQLGNIYDPTASIGGEAPQGRMAFWGAPISAWFYAPLSLLPPIVALIVLKVIGTAAFAAGLILLYRELRPTAARNGGNGSWFLAAVAVLVLLFQPFWTGYRVGGQTTPIVFLLLVLGLRAYLRDRMLSVAVCMLFVVLIKPAFIFVPGLLALFSGRRFFVTLVVVFAVTGLGSIALFGWPIHREFLEVMARGSGKPSPWPFNSSLYIIADAFRPVRSSLPMLGAGGWFPGALLIGIKVFVLATFVRLLIRSRREPWTPERRRLFVYLMAISFCLLISRVVWEHYLSILFIPLAFLLAGFPAMTRTARVHLGTIFALSLLQNLVLVHFFRTHVPLTSSAALLAVSLVKAGPLLLYLAFLWMHEAVLFRLVATLVPAAQPAERPMEQVAGAVA
jgi:hypothetical protein